MRCKVSTVGFLDSLTEQLRTANHAQFRAFSERVILKVFPRGPELIDFPVNGAVIASAIGELRAYR